MGFVSAYAKGVSVSKETDQIKNSIAGLESKIDSLNDQKAQVERYLHELEAARGSVGNERASFYEKLAQRRAAVSSMGAVSNAAIAGTISSRMQDAFGSSFESGVDGGFMGLANDIEANMQAARSKLDEIAAQARKAKDDLNSARDDLRVQAAKEEAQRAERKGA